MLDPNFKIDLKLKPFNQKIKSLKNPERLLKNLTLFGDNEMRKQARNVVYSYKTRTPSKRTGNLLRSIRIFTISKFKLLISSDTRNAGLSDKEYSKFVESGNKKTKVPPRPYVKNTFTNMKKELKKMIDNYVNK